MTSKLATIELKGDVRANGSAGGDVNGTAGDGGVGTILDGGVGGKIGGGGAGGAGGTITLNAIGVTTNNHTIAADGGKGGDVIGKAGDGGASTGGPGGKGGNVVKAGKGGGKGKITINDKEQSTSAGQDSTKYGTLGAGGKGNPDGATGDYE
jgi:hypothetical protein